VEMIIKIIPYYFSKSKINNIPGQHCKLHKIENAINKTLPHYPIDEVCKVQVNNDTLVHDPW